MLTVSRARFFQTVEKLFVFVDVAIVAQRIGATVVQREDFHQRDDLEHVENWNSRHLLHNLEFFTLHFHITWYHSMIWRINTDWLSISRRRPRFISHAR